MKESTTAKNTRITILADIVQKARKMLVCNNPSLCFSENDTRRIVLICLLYLRRYSEKIIPAVLSYSDVLHSLNISCSGAFSIDATQDYEVITVTDTILTLKEIESDEDWRSLIVYSFESLEYDVDSYFAVKVNRGVRNNNKKKKSLGIYYTPNDVVSFMASRCISTLTRRTAYPAVIDCSCGSGVFLLQCLKELETVYNTEQSLERSLQILCQCIWGVDISSAAIDSSKAAFAQYYLDKYDGAIEHFDSVWKTIEYSFYLGDGTNLRATVANNDSFPAKFDCIIGNPPYVTLGKDGNLFIDFVNNMMEFSSEIGMSSLILPLSVCYAQGGSYIALRKRIQIDCAAWEVLNFDRSPDSLFGDQVKTRNTILFRDALSKKHTVRTSSLQRWTSEKRSQLFKGMDLCDISEFDISRGIPKISGVGAVELYNAILAGSSCPSDEIKKKNGGPPYVVVNGTAYNWLCIYDHRPPSVDENGNSYLSGTTRTYSTEDEKAKYFCIALLSNRIAYWYWTATGDGFHFNASFFDDFHVGRSSFTETQFDELCELGHEYSDIIKQHPTVSYNAGKTIINYSHWEAIDVIKRIELIILAALNLPLDCGEQVANWYENQVRCSRE